jgi:hypothetical protein
VQQFPLPLMPQTVEVHMAFEVHAAPSASPLVPPVVVPLLEVPVVVPVVVPDVVPVVVPVVDPWPVVLPAVPVVVVPPEVVPPSSVVDELQPAATKHPANPSPIKSVRMDNPPLEVWEAP